MLNPTAIGVSAYLLGGAITSVRIGIDYSKMAKTEYRELDSDDKEIVDEMDDISKYIGRRNAIVMLIIMTTLFWLPVYTKKWIKKLKNKL